jgi:hypothetical protein
MHTPTWPQKSRGSAWSSIRESGSASELNEYLLGSTARGSGREPLQTADTELVEIYYTPVRAWRNGSEITAVEDERNASAGPSFGNVALDRSGSHVIDNLSGDLLRRFTGNGAGKF